MSNFKGWTSEAIAAKEQKQLAKRLDLNLSKTKERVSETVNEARSIVLQPAKPYNSPIIDDFLALGNEKDRKRTERRMMREARIEALKQKQIAKRTECEEIMRRAKNIASIEKRLLDKEAKLDQKKQAQIEAQKIKQESGGLARSQIRQQNPEYKLQAYFVKEMTRRYPEIMVFSDCAAHIKKTMFQQKRANALSTPGEKWPDVFVLQPSGDSAGLFLEFKAASPYKKDGITLLSNPHNEAQRDTMQRLSERGYECHFVWDVAQAMSIVDNYLKR